MRPWENMCPWELFSSFLMFLKVYVSRVFGRLFKSFGVERGRGECLLALSFLVTYPKHTILIVPSFNIPIGVSRTRPKSTHMDARGRTFANVNTTSPFCRMQQNANTLQVCFCGSAIYINWHDNDFQHMVSTSFSLRDFMFINTFIHVLCWPEITKLVN